MYYKTIMDTNRPERSYIKDIEKKYYNNYNTFTGIIISIIFTINFYKFKKLIMFTKKYIKSRKNCK